jgi:hypothetical protein
MAIEQKISFWNDTITAQFQQPSNSSSSSSSSSSSISHHHSNQYGNNNIPSNVILQKILPLIKNEIMTICENEMLRTQELYRKEGTLLACPCFVFVLFFGGLEEKKNTHTHTHTHTLTRFLILP